MADRGSAPYPWAAMLWYQPASDPSSPSCVSTTALTFVMWNCRTSYFAIARAKSVMTRAVSQGSQATPSASRIRPRRPRQRATRPGAGVRSPGSGSAASRVVGAAVSSAPDGMGGCLHVGGRGTTTSGAAEA